MDLLVQQKIQAALKPLISQIHLLEERIRTILAQISSLQIQQQKMFSHNFSTLQSKIQVAHFESYYAEKSQDCQTVDKYSSNYPQKKSNSAKFEAQSKAQITNKQTINKSLNLQRKLNSPKSSKAEQQQDIEKKQLIIKQNQKEITYEEVGQKFRITQLQQVDKLTHEIDANKDQNSNQLGYEHCKKQRELTCNKINIINTLLHQSQLFQHFDFIEFPSKILSNSEASKDVAKGYNLISPFGCNSIKVQNPNNENHVEKTEQLKTSSLCSQRQLQKLLAIEAAIKTLQSQVITQQQDSAALYQELRSDGFRSKEARISLSPLNKKTKATNPRKSINQDKQKINKSTTQKQRNQKNQTKLTMKQSRLNQISVGKSVDKKGKKAKERQQVKTEKKKVEMQENQTPLNQQQKIEKDKYRYEKYGDANLSIKQEKLCKLKKSE